MKHILLTTLRALLKFLAKLTLARYKPAIIGITGSVGKTSTKEAVKAIVAHERTVRATLKNFNNELGLPLTILGDWTSTGRFFFWIKVVFVSLYRLIVKSSSYPEVLVLEYGVDRPGDMNYLLNIARPHISIFTAMGTIPVHVEFFSDPEAVFREKAKIVSQLSATGFAILNADDESVSKAKNDTRAHVLTFGFSEESNIRAISFSNHLDDDFQGVILKLVHGGSVVPIYISHVLGRTQGYAMAAAAAVGLVFGMNLVSIAEALGTYAPPNGRMRVIQGIKGSILIDDTYNSSPTAVKEAIESLKDIKAKHKIAVLGDMLEIGKYTLEAHEKVGKQVAKVVDILVTVGIRGKFIAESALKAGMNKKQVHMFMSIREASEFLQKKVVKDDVVLLKGSQSVRMERVTASLMEDPQNAEHFLVRQSPYWLARKGLYE